MNYRDYLKHKINYSIGLLLLLFQFGIAPNIAAQSRPITEVLSELGQHYQVFFSYDDDLLKDQQVSFEKIKTETVEDAITRLLSPLDFNYEKFEEKYYVIYSKDNNNYLSPLNQTPLLNKNKAKKKKTDAFLSSILLDTEKGIPIENAFVFIRNTSISTTSDLSGFFQLNSGDFSRGELVITHLNYRTLSIPLSRVKNLEETIFLAPKQLTFAAVKVNAKRAKSKKRKRWMKQFKKAFFGEGNNKRGMKLLNPEVVWFQEKEGELIAEAVDYLSIYNTALGYKLRFYLEEFRTDGEEITTYSGKVYFEDFKDKTKNQSNIERKRKRTYQRSKKYFFRSLLAGNLNEEQYPFGEAILDEIRQVIFYEPLTIDSLNIHRGLFQDTLFFDNFFAFSNKKMVASWGGNSMLNSYATCFLHPTNDRIIIDHSGEILNGNEITEVGYWTTRRLANLMPMEYNFVRPNKVQFGADDVVSNLAKKTSLLPQEKVYLHLNKPYFSLTESLWFKVYLLNAHHHQPNTLSKVVYVDLIDPEGQIAKSWTLHRDKVMDGDFRFNSKHQAGIYQLRAYTQNMRNESPEYFFNKTIQLYDPTAVGTKVVKTNLALKDLKSIENQVIVQIDFFPEGGVLVNNLSANMAFKISDELGKPLDLSGEIIDSKGNQITKFKTTHEGLGLFNFTPNLSETYKAIVQKNKQNFEFILPTAQPSGLLMRVNNRGKEKVFIEIEGTDSTILDGGYLVGHVRGQIFCFVEDLGKNKAIVIDKNSIPTGIAHFTLFNEENQPVAERLIFNEIGLNQAIFSAHSNDSTYQPRSKITLQLDTLNTKENWENADVSISVTDESVVKYQEYDENLSSYLILNSDLPNPIPNPNFYLNEIDNTKRFWLDLWLMTYGWRRFVWKEVVENLEPSFVFSPETGYSLKGYTTEKKNPKKRLPTQVLLTSLNQDFIYETQATDEDGNFHFKNLPYLDSISFIIQGRVKTRKNALDDSEEKMKLKGDRLVDFHFEKIDKPEVIQPKNKRPNLLNDNVLSDYLTYEQHSNTLDSIYNSIWKIDFDEEVVVRAKRKKPFRFGDTYDLNQMDWVPPNKYGTYLLSFLYTRANFVVDPTQAKMYYVKGRSKFPVSININGMGADREGSNPYRFLSLSADMIDYIYWNPVCVCVSVTTRSIPRSLQIKLESGILNYDHSGYAKAREFYAPDYSKNLPIHDEPDLRTAIHWVPEFRINRTQSSQLFFYAADTPSMYNVRIEGVTDTGIPVFEEMKVVVE